MQSRLKKLKKCSGFQHPIEIKSDSCDMWLIFEVRKLQKKLITQLFSCEMIIHKGAKRKVVEHMSFYKLLNQDKSFQTMKSFIKQMCKNILILNESNLVHGEINSKNIDLIIDQDSKSIKNVRLRSSEQTYEFGQVFEHYYVKSQHYEFTPPEILQNIENKVKSTVLENQKPWSHDIWSFGIVLLEISQGLPIETFENCRIQLLTNKSIMTKSILGAVAKYKPQKGELVSSKIKNFLTELNKVRYSNFRKCLQKFYNYELSRNEHFIDLVD